MFYLIFNGSILREESAEVCYDTAWHLSTLKFGRPSHFSLSNATDYFNSFYFDHFAC